MPLSRIGTKLVYFAHVPKCAGMSVETYLAERFGPLAFLNNRYGKTPEPQRWSRTSPQHIPEAIRGTYIPDAFLDASFAIVRHPAARLRSVFLFQRDIEDRISAETDFAQWLDDLTPERVADPFAYDGHLRPMIDTVPAAAHIFRLEDGLAPVVAWLDQLAGDTSEPRRIRSVNALNTRLSRLGRPPATLALTPEDQARIADLYPADYTRFGYDVAPPTGRDASLSDTKL